MRFDKIFDLTAGVYLYFHNIFYEKYFEDVSREFDEFRVNTHIYLFRPVVVRRRLQMSAQMSGPLVLIA